MAIISKGIGWSQESNLLWYILKQLNQLTGVLFGLKPKYKVYTALIYMGDGSATVFENTLEVTLTWTSSSGQITTGIVTPLIGKNNVYVQVSSSTSSNGPKIVSAQFNPSPWVVTVKQTDNAGVPDSNQNVFVEIRVYN